MIYIAHPLRGDVEGNKKKVTEIMQGILEKEILAISPVHAFGYVDPEGPQRRVMTECIRLLERCTDLWVYGDAESISNSTGVMAEVAYARAVGIPVTFKNEDTARAMEQSEKRIITRTNSGGEVI